MVKFIDPSFVCSSTLVMCDRMAGENGPWLAPPAHLSRSDCGMTIRRLKTLSAASAARFWSITGLSGAAFSPMRATTS
jgi:hypothetical protein